MILQGSAFKFSHSWISQLSAELRPYSTPSPPSDSQFLYHQASSPSPISQLSAGLRPYSTPSPPSDSQFPYHQASSPSPVSDPIPVQPEKKSRKLLHHAGLEQLEEEDDDADEYYPVLFQQPCQPERVNPMPANKTQELLGIQFKESRVPKMDHKQGETAVMECEESGTYNEEQMEEDATELPASPEIFREGARRPQRAPQGNPKFFYIWELGSPFVTTLGLHHSPPPHNPPDEHCLPNYISYGHG
ncbi:hypothetical protein CRENBAI_012926 [Crenichthys baileyi]|uniref:Uncharacterized protein n=1 Tax=Crenichthys baileyi TaxID=28760 RepID=A0AAV9R4B1_9TELE